MGFQESTSVFPICEMETIILPLGKDCIKVIYVKHLAHAKKYTHTVSYSYSPLITLGFMS